MSHFDAEAAAKRCSYLWKKLGVLYEKRAYDAVSKNLNHIALESARMAEVCFWKATGEMDSVLMKDVLPKST